MLKNLLLKTLFVSAALVLTNCGSDSSKDEEEKKNSANVTGSVPQKRLDWDAVPKKYYPEIKELSFTTDGIEQILVDVFSFDDDVEVVYEQSLKPNTGLLKVYEVFYESAPVSSLTASPSGSKLNLKGSGGYQCSIQTENRQITSLKGKCIVRIQVILPVDAKIEIQNVGKLISKRYIPISNESFLEALDDAIRNEDKFTVIDNYLTSYEVTSKKAALTSRELGLALSEFSFKDEKLKALSKLHSLVTDREKLNAMIEDQFGHFDREEARSIVGIN